MPPNRVNGLSSVCLVSVRACIGGLWFLVWTPQLPPVHAPMRRRREESPMIRRSATLRRGFALKFGMLLGGHVVTRPHSSSYAEKSDITALESALFFQRYGDH